jgi:ankyrin repeat protein
MPKISVADSLFNEILMVTDRGVVIGFKDNYRDILKDFIALYLDDKKVIELDEAEKKEIITKVKIETRSAFTEGEINDEVLKYAIAHDLYIDMGTTLSAIDPVREYLNSGDVLKRQYAIDHIKNNCDKYGGNATEITSQVENPTNAYYTYSDFITQRKFDKASAIARFFDKYNEKVAKSASLDESEKGNTTHIIDLLKAEELRKLREYNTQKEVILSRNKDGKRPLDTLFVNPLFSSITSYDKDGVMSILNEARECAILREVLNVKDRYGETALHLAANSGNADVVEKILAAIGDNKELLKDLLTAKDKNGDTALHLAAESGKTGIVEKILAAAKKQELLKEVLTAKSKNGMTLLPSAALSGNADLVEKILAAIGDNKELLKEMLTAEDNYKSTVLHEAARVLHRTLDYSGKADVVEKILAAIGDNKELLKEMLNLKDKYGETALYFAVRSGKSGIVEKILKVAKNLNILGEVVGGLVDLVAESGNTDVVSKILAAIGDNKELLKEVLIGLVGG